MSAMNDYLEQIGITQWRSIYTLPGARCILEFETYALRRVADNQLLGQLDLQVLSTTAASEQAIKNLLTAMLAAVGCQYEPMPPALPEDSLRVLMGLPLIQRTLNTIEEIDALRANNPHPNNLWVTYHPADLLTNPANKRKAWNDLQAWCKTNPSPLVGEGAR